MASPTPVNPNWTRPPRRRSVFGPIVLITIGILFLLVNTGRISARNMFVLFAEYWPLLLILWGAAKLFEYMQAKREGYPPPGIGGGGVVLLIFIILFGTAISAARRGMNEVNWGKVRDEIQIDDEDLGGIFGERHEFSENLNHDFPKNGSLKATVEHGGLKISPSADDQLHVAVHKSLYAGSEDEAKKINDGSNPSITVVDNVVTVDASHRSEWKGGDINLEIFVPRKAAVDLNTQHGPIEVLGRDAEIKATNAHGDVTVEDIAGNVSLHVRGGNVTARKVKGDVNVEGRVSDVNVSEITGRLSLQGDYDEVQLANLAKGLHFNSTRTDLDFPKLEGGLNMSRGDLRADKLSGPFRLTTRSKDIHLEEISGDIHLENSNGEIDLRPKSPLGNIDISNQKGEVSLLLPPDANFTVDASALRGEIESDFNLNTSNNNHEARATGTINKGGAKVQIKNEHGTIALRKQ